MKLIVNQHVEQLKNAMAHFYPADGGLKKLDIDFVKRLSHIIEMHPGINRGQSKFIAENALLIAGGFDMSAEEKRDILYASLLIQLGKITLPNNLLKKPFYSMSTVEKYRYLGHAIDGEDLLKGLTQFAGAISIIRHQYERYNGQGFPDALVGPNIPLGSRILSVVRDYIGYHEGSKTGKVIYADAVHSQLMIRKESYYDPEVVDVFINALRGATVDELKAARAKSKLLAVATKQWKKGLKRSDLNKSLHFPSTIVEIALQQLKLGMKVDSIHFGSELYIRNCTVDQSIIDNVTRLTEHKGKKPIIKIFLSLE